MQTKSLSHHFLFVTTRLASARLTLVLGLNLSRAFASLRSLTEPRFRPADVPKRKCLEKILICANFARKNPPILLTDFSVAVWRVKCPHGRLILLPTPTTARQEHDEGNAGYKPDHPLNECFHQFLLLLRLRRRKKKNSASPAPSQQMNCGPGPMFTCCSSPWPACRASPAYSAGRRRKVGGVPRSL